MALQGSGRALGGLWDGWLWDSSGMALGWLWDSSGMALGWLFEIVPIV